MQSSYNPVILLVEDEPSDVFRIQRAFQKANLSISLDVVSDGEQAVSYLSRQEPFRDRSRLQPAVVLLDLKLPRLSGFEVLSWIKQQDEFKYLPVVILTSSEEPRDIKRAYALGANSYLSKPPAPNALLEMVHTFGLYWLTFNRPPGNDQD